MVKTISNEGGRRIVYAFLLGLMLLLSHTVCAVDLILNGGTATLSDTKNYETVNLTNGAILHVGEHGVGGGGRLRINALRVYVDSTSQIIGEGSGYVGGQGSTVCSNNPGEDGEDPYGGPAKDRADRIGAGEGGYSIGSKVEGAGGGGGAYGGTGGVGGNEKGNKGIPGLGGSIYGSSDSYEARMGSGGGGGAASCFKAAGGGKGGDGGAALEIVAAHSITIEGSIDCGGQTGGNGLVSGGSDGGGGGGGAGGGVLLASPRLNFTGAIDVSGGTGGSGGGSGGGGGGGSGGRVKLVGCTLNITGESLVEGGSPGASAGVDGTAGGNGTYMEVVDCYTFSLLPPHIRDIEIINEGENATNVTLSVVGSIIQGWVTIEPDFLTIPAFGSEIATVGVYPPFYLPKGYYYGQVKVDSGTDLLYVDLSIWVKRREILKISPNLWNTSVGAGWRETKVLSICNTGDTKLYGVMITTSEAADWILFPEGKNLGDLSPSACVYKNAILQVPENASLGVYTGDITVTSEALTNATLVVNVTTEDCGEWCQYSKFYSGLCRENQSECNMNYEGYNPFGSERYCSIHEPSTDTCCCYISCMDACLNKNYSSWNCENNCSIGWNNVLSGNTYCIKDEGYTHCCCM
ncbi:MAG: hypothetical protein JW778_03600 [Candidatus Altiarchaeota archaeon]|nr:hypothetical protein [Candidatus Altiarchaeota archaeon]